ncbi:hypothetical protein D3C72_2537250 [compost metagenome]
MTRHWLSKRCSTEPNTVWLVRYEYAQSAPADLERAQSVWPPSAKKRGRPERACPVR